MKLQINKVFIDKIRNSSFVKDSFWAVMGNGLGNFMLLISGIFIARYLGKDLYGEYGIVKSTMFMAALFATFGLGDTSTKFIAENVQKDIGNIKNIVHASLKIAFLFSSILCLGLFVCAEPLASYIGKTQLGTSFRFLGGIIVIRAINTVGAGILGGLKEYKRLGFNNIISGLLMIVLCIPLTKMYSLSGALCTLLLSQVTLAMLNLLSVYLSVRHIKETSKERFERELLVFSFPFAMNEFIFSGVNWGISLLFAKYASLGEFGMYMACSQWNAIILFMPGLLGNVILSYLSTTSVSDRSRHDLLVKRMLLVNFICTLIPLFVIILFSSFITQYYGPTFDGMKPILEIMVLGTVFTCMSRVFQSNLMSEGKKWEAFFIRSSYNILQLIITYVVLRNTRGENAAMNMAILSVFINFLAFVLYGILYKDGNGRKGFKA